MSDYNAIPVNSDAGSTPQTSTQFAKIEGLDTRAINALWFHETRVLMCAMERESNERAKALLKVAEHARQLSTIVGRFLNKHGCVDSYDHDLDEEARILVSAVKK